MSDSSDAMVVVSKLKKYIRAKAGMSTGSGAAAALSDIVRQLCDQAIENAKRDRRKTVKDRDFTISD